ncbi:MAG: hypothetical protein MUF16_25790 [Burkholderiaceae bacterium]|jgi:hypothetical protein|nr:hypothetical protein [Burkholderiaceae bacterium]
MPEYRRAVPQLGDGLFNGLLRLVRLDDNSPKGVRRRVVFIALLAWLPLLVLAAAQGHLVEGVAVPFVRDIEAHVRLLIVIPLLLIAEVEARRFLPAVVQEFPRRNLVAADAMPRFEAAVASSSRLRNSALAEAVLIVLVYAVFMSIIWRQHGSSFASTWYAHSTASGPQLTLAGYWLAFVSLPIVQFLMLRWYLWIFAWARFLWQMSRIRLELAPTHPDRAGGLGFLESSGHIFLMVAVAHGALAAGPIASLILFKGAALPEFADELALVTGWVIVVVFGPLLFFMPQLVAAKKAGLFEYGRLSERYVREFHAKWLDDRASAKEPLIGSADIQSLADLGNAYNVVDGLRLAPISYVAVIRLAVTTLLPVAPLLLTMVPLNELVLKLFSFVL